MKKITLVFCAVFLSLVFFSAVAEDTGLAVTAPNEEIRPGRASIIVINAPVDGSCSIYLEDEDRTRVSTVVENRTVTAGYNALYWNGTDAGLPAPVGEWTMTAEMNGERAEAEVLIGTLVPSLISPKLETETVEEGDTALLSFFAPCDRNNAHGNVCIFFFGG